MKFTYTDRVEKKGSGNMKGKLIMDGTAVYELDEECLKNKKCHQSDVKLQNEVRKPTEKGQVVDHK